MLIPVWKESSNLQVNSFDTHTISAKTQKYENIIQKSYSYLILIKVK